MTAEKKDWRQSRQARWRERNPWYKLWSYARDRCARPSCRGYENYGGRGIRCELTVADVKLLYTRDRGAEMDTPTIDRLDENLHYTLGNCRVIERRDNIAESNSRRARCRREEATEESRPEVPAWAML